MAGKGLGVDFKHQPTSIQGVSQHATFHARHFKERFPITQIGISTLFGGFAEFFGPAMEIVRHKEGLKVEG